ncbi:MAG TPA: hypothetical protein PKI99_06605 [Terrimesophilobacter sp.]|nr:hypothetical protein [Terrimesophilobacter sp.]
MRKHNPWIGALWAIGVVLVVGAYSAGVWQSTFFYPPPGRPDPGPVVEFFQALADVLKGPSLLAGFSTIAGLLFLHARKHARRATKKPSR